MFNTIKNLEITKPNTWTVLSASTMNALAASETDATLYGAFYKLTDRDARYLLMVKNTHSTDSLTVKVIASDTLWAGREPTVTLSAGQEAIIQLESGRHKFVAQDAALIAHNGDVDNVGCVFITSTSASIKACMFHTVL